MDPEFSSDGEWLYYTSGVSGSLNLRRRHLTSGADEQLTELSQVERNARRLAKNDGSCIYMQVGLTGYFESKTLRPEPIQSHLPRH
ncbi:hypothetical protein [Algoriphagus boritolerans]|uniref:hypothetical protein n=1 Tax=Algoriphagus boritolerans TaxID=308111 RepID=UPI000B1BD2C4